MESMETLDPPGGASLDHKGLIGRIYVGREAWSSVLISLL